MRCFSSGPGFVMSSNNARCGFSSLDRQTCQIQKFQACILVIMYYFSARTKFNILRRFLT